MRFPRTRDTSAVLSPFVPLSRGKYPKFRFLFARHNYLLCIFDHERIINRFTYSRSRDTKYTCLTHLRSRNKFACLSFASARERAASTCFTCLSVITREKAPDANNTRRKLILAATGMRMGALNLRMKRSSREKGKSNALGEKERIKRERERGGEAETRAFANSDHMEARKGATASGGATPAIRQMDITD